MAPMPPQGMARTLIAVSYWMLRAVMTGSSEGAVTGRSSRRRILRLPAAWWRCGIGFTRNLLRGYGTRPGQVNRMCHKHEEISTFHAPIMRFGAQTTLG